MQLDRNMSNKDHSRGRCATAAIVKIDPYSKSTKKTQIEISIRNAINQQRLRPGFRVPSTRNLAASLGISRNTVGAAYDELIAEGYLESKEGSGTYVSDSDQNFSGSGGSKDVGSGKLPTPKASARAIEARNCDVTVVPQFADPGAFRPGIPYVDPLSSKTWIKLAADSWRSKRTYSQLYGDKLGVYRLRASIAEFLAAYRGMRCSPEQVLIVNGSQQGLSIAFQLVADSGHDIWVTDPVRTGVKAALRSANLNPVWFSSSNIGISPLPRNAGNIPKALCISPDSQFPMGTRLSLQQRQALLSEVSVENAWIIEDEFDGSFQYQGQPILPLHALGAEERTIYVGSFSRSLFPSIRIGYLVVPESILDCAVGLKSFGDRGSSIWMQHTLARFIEEGHYWRHLRRTQLLYKKRQDLLVQAIRKLGGEMLDVKPSEGGMHLLVQLENMSDRRAEELIYRAGIETVALSRFRCSSPLPSALLLGFSIADERFIGSNVARMMAALNNER